MVYYYYFWYTAIKISYLILFNLFNACKISRCQAFERENIIVTSKKKTNCDKFVFNRKHLCYKQTFAVSGNFFMTITIINFYVGKWNDKLFFFTPFHTIRPKIM